MKFGKIFLAALLAVVVGGVVSLFVWFLMLTGIVGALGSLGSSAPATVEPNTILKIDLAQSIVDAPSQNPMANFDFSSMTMSSELTLYKALSAIEAAAGDDRIEGIYIRLNGGGSAQLAVLEELRAALLQFRESGKFIYAYSEAWSQSGYYLASTADGIYMQPQGGMDWHGMGFNLMFYKGLLDKLGVDVQIFRPTACKYKSAVEPYFLKKMSDENREQMSALAESMWHTMLAEIAESRGMEPEQLDAWADDLKLATAEDAVEAGMIDGLKYEDEIDSLFAEAGVEPDDDGEFRFVSLGDYASQLTPDLKNLSADKIAVVYAEGQIADGSGSDDMIYGNTLAATLRGVRKDDKVKALVLRVNSPGGSALASDVIWREMQLLREKMPVVVSMGQYAASGGYYISCPADVIVANRTTLTGSIGVFGMIPDAGDALERKLGLTFDGVKTNTSADLSIYRPLTAAEKRSILRGVDKVYDTFTGYVAAGRNLPLERVLEIAGGRVWSGADALNIGLADANGGLKAAIAAAVEKSGVGENYRIEEVRDEPTGLAALFSSFNAGIRASAERSELKELYGEYARARRALSQRGVMMYCPYEFDFE